MKNFNGYGFYQSRANELDHLYLITIEDGYALKEGKNLLFKIGRTFQYPEKRFPNNLVQIYKIWTATHKIIWELENMVLEEFREYAQPGSTSISGRTECFSKELPFDKVILFIDKEISSLASNTLLEGSETTGEVKSS